MTQKQLPVGLLVAIMLLVTLLSSLRPLYRNLVHNYCLRDASLIDASRAPMSSQFPTREWGVLAGGQGWLGDDGTALCFAQRAMLEGHDPFASGLSVPSAFVIRDRAREGLLPVVRLTLRALAARDLGSASAVDVFLSAISTHGFLPSEWLYQPYEQSMVAVLGGQGAPTARIVYHSVNSRDNCIVLEQRRVEWGLPISVRDMHIRTCRDEGGEPHSKSQANGYVYNLIPNGGFEWSFTATGSVPGYEGLVYEGNDTRGVVQKAGDSRVLTMNNGPKVSRQGRTTTKLPVVPGQKYVLGATVYSAGGRPHVGINCWLETSKVWTWYAIKDPLADSSWLSGLFDVGQIPDTALDCYAVLLNLDSQGTVWFDNVFLLPVSMDDYAGS